MTPSQQYTALCATCHGPTGAGAGAGPNISTVVSRLGTDAVRAVVADGRKAMPAFGSVLSATQTEQMVAYLATLDR